MCSDIGIDTRVWIKMIKLDGSHGEGGGAIVRLALALSTLLGKPFEVSDIRKERNVPGLKAQHLTCITALQKLCNAEVEGAELGSSFLKYVPGRIKPKTLNIDIGTAGSITLLLQSLLLPCFFAGKRVRLRIKGGTDVQWSMPFDYFNEVYVPHIAKFCKSIDVKLLKRGYYPKGNGLMEIAVKPLFDIYSFDNYAEFIEQVSAKVQDINLIAQGRLSLIKGVAHSSRGLQKKNVAERLARGARQALGKFDVPVKIRTEYQDTLSDGCGITLWAVFSSKGDVNYFNPVRLGADSLGRPGKIAEAVGKEAAEMLAKAIESNAPVDEYLADNLIPWLIFGGKYKAARLSKHTLANIYTVEKFLGQLFKVDKEQNVIALL